MKTIKEIEKFKKKKMRIGKKVVKIKEGTLRGDMGYSDLLEKKKELLMSRLQLIYLKNLNKLKKKNRIRLIETKSIVEKIIEKRKVPVEQITPFVQGIKKGRKKKIGVEKIIEKIKVPAEQITPFVQGIVLEAKKELRNTVENKVLESVYNKIKGKYLKHSRKSWKLEKKWSRDINRLKMFLDSFAVAFHRKKRRSALLKMQDLEKIKEGYPKKILEADVNDKKITDIIKEDLKKYRKIEFGFVFVRFKNKNVFVTLTDINKKVIKIQSGGKIKHSDIRSKGYKKYKRSLIAREEIGNDIGKICWEKGIGFINMFWITNRPNKGYSSVGIGLLQQQVLIGRVYYRVIKGHGEIRAPARRRL
jgi:ribosomal protein S11